jgi:hypothetical protein
MEAKGVETRIEIAPVSPISKNTHGNHSSEEITHGRTQEEAKSAASPGFSNYIVGESWSLNDANPNSEF